MTLLRPIWCAVLLLAVSAPSVRADDVCGGDQERQKATASARAALAKAEKSGSQAELFLVYQDVSRDDCLAKDLIDKALTGMTKVGRDLAGKAEAKGWFYSGEPVASQVGEGRRANERASAFAWFEAARTFTEANRVMLKAVQAKPEDLGLFQAAWQVDQRRPGSTDANTGETIPYTSPPAYRQQLERLAAANADRLMKAEEQDAKSLSGSAADVAMASGKSIEKLRIAAEWMKYLPGGERPARERAEQRGDVISKRSDPMFTQANARMYYEFAGSAKAKAAVAQIDKKLEDFQRATEKSGESIKGAITQKSEADQKTFDKKKADLEKELGF
jgi:hypothetical protein